MRGRIFTLYAILASDYPVILGTAFLAYTLDWRRCFLREKHQVPRVISFQ